MGHAAAKSVDLVAATVADAYRLDAYLTALRQDDPMPAHDHADRVAVGRALFELLRDLSLGRLFLIRVDSQPAGYVALTFVHSLEFGGRCAFIDEFFVDRPFRGAGVGKEALRQVIEIEAPALAVRALFLEVSEKNVAACGLYCRAGFERRDYGLMTRWLLPGKKDS